VFGCKQPAGDKSTGNNKFKEGPAAVVKLLPIWCFYDLVGGARG
jgi:hypothetical protein